MATGLNKDNTDALSLSSSSWVIEDDPSAAKAIKAMFENMGCSSRVFSNGQQVLNAIKQGLDFPDIICLDLSLPDISGLDLLPSIRRQDSNVPIVVITANTSKASIAQAVELGVYDYLPKNSDRTKFTTTFRRAIEHCQLSRKLLAQEQLEHSPQFGIIGVSPSIKSVIEQINELAGIDVNVLIYGETGTGKELVARGLHAASTRRNGPLVAINCAVLPRDLLESELFGHERGAFTSAEKRHIGAFERANHGTLFLDEIGELDLALQAKLLRAIQERRFFRIGGSKEISSDFRLIAATNRDLYEDSANGSFRKDLYYRLGVAEINISPLRSRMEDIALLANSFTKEFNQQLDKQVALAPETIKTLCEYSWPGNVRELQNVIHYALIQCNQNLLTVDYLPGRVLGATERVSLESEALNNPRSTEVKSRDQQEKEAIIEALRKTQGNIVQASRLLEISRATLYRNLKKHKISTRGRF